MNLTDIMLFGKAIIGDGGGTSGGALCAVYHSSIDYETVEGMPHFSTLAPVDIKGGIVAFKGIGANGVVAGEMTIVTDGYEIGVMMEDIVVALVITEEMANSDANTMGYKVGMYVLSEGITDIWIVWEEA